MKIGLTLTGDQITLSETIRFAREAEDAGFDSVWVTELWRDAFVPLTAIAMETKRVRIGTAIALVMARSPALMELHASSVDELSGGRLVLGIGPGPKAWNENWHGVRFYPPAPYLREYTEVLRLMWTAHSGRSIDYEGKYLKIRGYQRFPVPYRERIPIYFGAVMPRLLHATGAVADGLCLTPFHTARYITDIVRPHIAEGQKEAKREGQKLEFACMTVCAVDADGKKARERAKGQIAFYSTIPYYDVVLDLHGFSQQKKRIREAWSRGDVRGMIGAVTDDMVALIAVAGTPAECREQLTRYEGLVDEVKFYSPTTGLSRDEVVANHQATLRAFRR